VQPKPRSLLLVALLAMPFCSTAYAEWLPAIESTISGKSYSLNPTSLKITVDNRFQIGLKIINRQRGGEFSDLQVTGCDKGTGFYKTTFEGDMWRKPRRWDRKGTQDFDKISSTMCEMIRECTGSYQSAIAQIKAGQKVDYVTQGKYFKDESVAFLAMVCEDGK